MERVNSVKNRRKYQRVLVEPSDKHLITEIVNFGSTVVFDMSYSGAALGQPKEKQVTEDNKEILVLLKTPVDEALLKAKVVRAEGDMVAVQFIEITVEARVIIDRVVTDRMIGVNMFLIDSRHYSPNSDFNFWFHGPKETNLYLWVADDRLVKAQMELDSSLLFFEDDSFIFEQKFTQNDVIPKMNNQQIAAKALGITQQIEIKLDALVEFKNLLSQHVNV